MTDMDSLLRDLKALIKKLPEGAQWDVMLTHDVESKICFNLWFISLEYRDFLVKALDLGIPDWASDTEEEHEYSQRITLALRRI